ncbi:MAG: polyprenol monophosphomannose synthase, partial [Actinomycetota bacterium]
MSTTVVLPTYNERPNIVALLEALRQVIPEASILVIDDGSPDGTGAAAEECAHRLENIDVQHRAGKEGLGSAYRFGFARVLSSMSDPDSIVVTMDSDFSHDPAVVPRLVAAIHGGADAVIGSRYVVGGGTVDWPVHRRLLSRLGNLYTGAILGVGVRDCTSGFRAYRAQALRSIRPETTGADGYAFLTELVARLSRQGSRIEEVPITFVDRRYGTSKMSGRIIAESMLLVTRWGLVHRWRQVTGRF